MGKIRLKDLARMMKRPEQDLLFMLKSIGVRVEGDDEIDSEIIQAILQGKRLPQPREVILRDAEGASPQPAAPKPVSTKSPRPAAPPKQPLRPKRRAMIQRVEPKIRELEVKEKAEAAAAAAAKPETAEAKATAAQAPVAKAPVATEQAAADSVAEATVATPAEAAAQTQQEAPRAAAAATPAPATTQPSVDKPAAKPEKVAATEGSQAQAEPAKGAAVKATAVKATAEKAAAGKAEPAKAAKPGAKATAVKPSKKDEKQPPRGLRKRARIISTPDPNKPIPDLTPRRPSRPPSRPSRPGASRPGSRPPRGRGRGGQPQKVYTPSEPVPQAKPASARGHRRVQMREERAARAKDGTASLIFKEAKPDGPVMVSHGMTVREFADKLGVKSKDLIKMLFSRGMMATINHTLDLETAKELGDDLGIDVMEVSFEEEVQLHHEEAAEDVPKTDRAPVVTVMGHVDHGKTSLLDAIRKTDVAAGEAGGITQSVGAYHVDVQDRQIVFLDTPGHEAFTMMRARGAKVTDIVILVVAADDGVMPQTIEAIDHAKAAKVPIVVAINKVDKPNANLDRVRKELADHNLLVEDWGGDVVSVPVSAIKGDGLPELLEMVLLTADILELKAAPSLPARGVVLEARKDVGRGVVASVVLQDGTLSKGNVFVAGSTWGRVRTMTDDRGKRLKESGPATAVEITGFDDLPSAGDIFQVHADEGKVREIAEFRQVEERQKELAPKVGRVSLENLLENLGKDEVKELPVVVKADVDGSVEVLKDTLLKLSTEKVTLNVIRAAVGAITTNDVLFASASEAIIVGFNVRPERNASQLAEQEGIDIRLHTVIYELLDEIKAAMAGLLEPVIREVQRGTAEVRDTFKVPKVGVIAGCHVVDGVIPRNAGARLLRDNVVIWEGKLASLRRFKDDASEVRQGFDCGIGLEGYQDIKPGDYIEAFVREEVAATL